MWRKILIGAAFGLVISVGVNAAVSPLKTWTSNEVLTASDLNAEFLNIYNNGEDLGWPASQAKDLNGFALQLDSDQDTTIDAGVDDRIDLTLSGSELFRFDGTIATPVNGLDFVASAATGDVAIQAIGTDTDISIDFIPKGAGVIKISGTTLLTDLVNDTTPQLGGQLDVNGNAVGDGTLELLTFTETGSAVNHLNITNAATLGTPVIAAAGDDADVDLGVRSKGDGNVVIADDGGAEILIAADVASAVNELTVTNSAAASGVTIAATGDDTDIDLNVNSKGGGDVVFNSADGEIAKMVDVANGVNFPQLEPSATGNPVKLSANGDDATVGIELETKGTGSVTIDTIRAGPLTIPSSIDLSAGAPTSVTLLSSLPAGVNTIEIHFEGFSTNSANQAPLIQLSDSGGFEVTGYSGLVVGGGSTTSNSTGFLGTVEIFQDAASLYYGQIVLRHYGSNVWNYVVNAQSDSIQRAVVGNGVITLDSAITGVRLTTTGGAATIDAGTGYVRWN